MTVLEVIKRSSEFLTKKGVESPRLQVELLLAHLLGLKRMQLYLNFERLLTPKELDALRELVKRRGEREPLQHVVGSTSFHGLEMAVNSHVLVPRQETEILAQLGWEFLNVLPASAKTPSMLDFGTGSGCLAITMAVKSPLAEIVAIDISPEALAVAKRNAITHKMDSRIQFICTDGFTVVPPTQQFDLILANPPYIPSAEIATLEPEVRDFDPRLALDGGADGLAFYRRLATEAQPFLKSRGRIMLELGDGQAEAVEKLFSEQKWVVESVKPDYNKTLRFLIARQAD